MIPTSANASEVWAVAFATELLHLRRSEPQLSREEMRQRAIDAAQFVFDQFMDGIKAPETDAATGSYALLSPREREVASLVVKGIRGNTIAQRLGRSPHTIRNQMKAIYRKLHVHNQLELVALLQHQSHAKEEE